MKKLRNKKTGEIPDKIEAITYIQWSKKIMMVYINNNGERIVKQYDSLETFNEEWEDYEEPKGYWAIDMFAKGATYIENTSDDVDKFNKEIGNSFETEEECEKATEKRKAWTRLKNKGFRFTGWQHDIMNQKYIITMEEKELEEWVVGRKKEDLDLLFGGEE